MANPASIADLEALWRPLSTSEQVTGLAWLDAAWTVLQARVPDIQARIDALDVTTGLAKVIVCQMVLRVLKNPEGKREEAIDDYRWVRDNAVSSGMLYLSDDELALVRGGASDTVFSIRGYGEPDVVSPYGWRTASDFFS